MEDFARVWRIAMHYRALLRDPGFLKQKIIRRIKKGSKIVLCNSHRFVLFITSKLQGFATSNISLSFKCGSASDEWRPPKWNMAKWFFFSVNFSTFLSPSSSLAILFSYLGINVLHFRARKTMSLAETL